ncbi:snRNA-activating protein complex subunit 3-like [Schistocerca gregaria]|uniref:snRNA-activating protein complex subunit 3-like n=1 Tax=Schistocerca gregaria TaxID=7010 RepID=UPI00211E7E88|nr:snRNA-activating protein complex subunit 3-like [Schistocerca gregaria]
MLQQRCQYPWVSEPVKISEYYDNFKQMLSSLLPNTQSSEVSHEIEENVKQLQIMGANITLEQFRQLDAECDPQLLDFPGEPPSVNVDLIKAKRGLFDGSKAPRYVPLATLYHAKEKDVEKENPAYLKYTGTIWLDDKKGQGRDLNPGDDILIIVRVYEPFSSISGSRKIRPITCSHEIAVLGNQTLDKLRDKIMCPSGLAVDGDLSENPEKSSDKVAKEIYKSGFFFFEDIFYNDFRHENNIDYSAVIREWAERKKIGNFGTAVMEETAFMDLTVRFGFPYVYQHLGNCEHLIVFSDARLLHADDFLCTSDYPRFLTVNARKSKYCMVCKFYSARWVTLDNKRVPHDPCFFCDICFKSFNYRDGEKIGSFRAYRYHDRASMM